MSITFRPRVWLNIMFDPIWPIERTMFEAVLKTESNEVRLIAQSQLADCNFAQRLERGKEVFFYNIAFGIFPKKVLYRINSNIRERKFSTVKLSLRTGEIVSCDFWLICGQIGHLTYSVPVNSKRVKGAEIIEIHRHPPSASGTDNAHDIEKEIFDDLTIDDLKEFTEDSDFVFYGLKDAYTTMTEFGSFKVVGAFSEDDYLVYPIIDNVETSRGYYIMNEENLEFLSHRLIPALKISRERGFS